MNLATEYFGGKITLLMLSLRCHPVGVEKFPVASGTHSCFTMTSNTIVSQELTYYFIIDYFPITSALK